MLLVNPIVDLETYIKDLLTALAHRSGVLEKALPCKRGRLDQRWPLEVAKGVHVAGVLADDSDRHIWRRGRALRAHTRALGMGGRAQFMRLDAKTRTSGSRIFAKKPSSCDSICKTRVPSSGSSVSSDVLTSHTMFSLTTSSPTATSHWSNLPVCIEGDRRGIGISLCGGRLPRARRCSSIARGDSVQSARCMGSSGENTLVKKILGRVRGKASV